MNFEPPPVEAALNALLMISPMAIVATDSRRRVTMWNPAAETLFGWTKSEVLGKEMPPILRDAKDPENSDAKEASSSGFTHKEARCEKRDGTMIDVAFWCTPLGDGEDAGRIGFVMDVSERKFLEMAILDASEREHKRIGQDLHDHLCQQLLGAAFAAKAIGISLTREGSPAASEVDRLASLINGSVRQVREIARGLHPVELDSGGLMSALQELARRINTTIPCVFECEGTVLLDDPPAALHVFRIAHEALMHLIQDRGATHLVISMENTGDEVIVGIRAKGPLTETDDDPMTRKIMEYRADVVGASITFQKLPSGGMAIKCHISPKTTTAPHPVDC